MINFLSGTIKHIAPQVITLDTSGVGFAVSVSDENLFSLNQNVGLFIYFHWNAENGPQLFGFTSELDKNIFMLIISCSGIGPKIALTLQSQMSSEQFLQAIALTDTKALSSISGIGPKKAELIIMQLQNKTSKITPDNKKSFESASLTKIRDLTEALTSLNYSRQEISGALDYLKQQNMLETRSFDEILRKVLSFLAKR